MSLAKSRTAADLAVLRQHLCRAELHTRWAPLQERLRTLRPVWLVGAGLASGAMAARIPMRAAVGTFSTLLGVASFFIRTPFLNLVVARVARLGFKKH